MCQKNGVPFARSPPSLHIRCTAACAPLNLPAATYSTHPPCARRVILVDLCSNIERWWRGLTWRISRRLHKPCNEIEVFFYCLAGYPAKRKESAYMGWSGGRRRGDTGRRSTLALQIMRRWSKRACSSSLLPRSLLRGRADPGMVLGSAISSRFLCDGNMIAACREFTLGSVLIGSWARLPA